MRAQTRGARAASPRRGRRCRSRRRARRSRGITAAAASSAFGEECLARLRREGRPSNPGYGTSTISNGVIAPARQALQRRPRRLESRARVAVAAEEQDDGHQASTTRSPAACSADSSAARRDDVRRRLHSDDWRRAGGQRVRDHRAGKRGHPLAFLARRPGPARRGVRRFQSSSTSTAPPVAPIRWAPARRRATGAPPCGGPSARPIRARRAKPTLARGSSNPTLTSTAATPSSAGNRSCSGPSNVYAVRGPKGGGSGMRLRIAEARAARRPRCAPAARAARPSRARRLCPSGWRRR